MNYRYFSIIHVSIGAATARVARVRTNVPSKLCACARAHGLESERTQKFKMRTQKDQFF